MTKYSSLFFLQLGIILIIFTGWFGTSQAQENVLSNSKAFEYKETIQYKLVFRWGIFKGKIGEASLSNSKVNSGQQYFSQLHFKTTGVGDAFYSMRDTLETLYSVDHKPLRFEKRINEKGFAMIDEISFTHSPTIVRATVRALTSTEVKVDTVYTYNPKEVEVFDVLSSLAFVRGFNLSAPELINGKRIVMPIGNSQAFAECSFQGTEEMKMPDGSRVEAVIISMDIKDEVFQTQKNSVMVWVTNDEYRIPVKVTANLKVGSVVVELMSYRNMSRS